MRRLIIAISASLAAGSHPAMAQHKPAVGQPEAILAGSELPPSDDFCKAIKSPRLIARQVRSHGGSVSVAPTWPSGRPLSADEVKRMLKACEAKDG
jgi:hypothetical protein